MTFQSSLKLCLCFSLFQMTLFRVSLKGQATSRRLVVATSIGELREKGMYLKLHISVLLYVPFMC